MQFHRADPDEQYFLRFESESSRWEIGFYKVLFGVRVRAGLKGEMWCPVDYCASDNIVFAAELLECMLQILETFPETVTTGEIMKILPGYEKRPINLDPCWSELQKLRDQLKSKQEGETK